MTGLPQHDADALAAAVAAEHAAVFAYGLVQAYVRHPATAELAEAVVAEHRADRDAAAGLLLRSGARPPAAAPAYTVPSPVTDGPSAASLATMVEQETAQAWRATIERATLPAVRELGIHALERCAVRAAQWRDNLGLGPKAEPFPGEGER